MKKYIFLFIFILIALMISCSESGKIVNDPAIDDPIDEPVFDPGEISVSDLPREVSDLIALHGLPEDGSHSGNLLSPAFSPPEIVDTSYDVYSVTLMWGNHSQDNISIVTPPMDWSGTLSVNGVAWVLPIRAILFEDEDIILDNPNPAMAAWESVTHGGYDGINFLVFLKRGVTYITAPLLSFDTEPIAISWDFGSLNRLFAYYQTDEGAGLGIYAHKIYTYNCPKGGFTGEWIKDGDSPHSGHFDGLWMDANAGTTNPIGFYHGRFWMGDDGVGRFSGWVTHYILAQVLAEFEGQWFYDDPSLCPTCGENRGKFKGRIKWLDHDASGEMWGGFNGINITTDSNRLPMAGFWREHCVRLDRFTFDLHE